MISVVVLERHLGNGIRRAQEGASNKCALASVGLMDVLTVDGADKGQ